MLAALAVFLLAACFEAFGAGTGEWAIRTGDISDYAILPDGGLALASGNAVISYDSDGTKRWQWAADSPVMLLASAQDGTVVAAYGSTMVRLDASGKRLWAADTYERAHSLAIMEGGIFVGWEFGLMKFSLSGNLEWEYYRPEDC